MKTSILFFAILALFTGTVFSQNQKIVSHDTPQGLTYGEFKAGYGINQFYSGLEERFNNGNFSASGGGLYSIAAYRKFEKIDHFHFGLKFMALGAAPSSGDNDEEMFFNFWGAAISTKYFAFSKSATEGFYIQGDYNFVSQFTQKYRNTDALDFDHQFAIGSSFALGLGYQYTLKKRYALLASVEYDWASRQGEVNNVGDVQFTNSSIGFQLGLIF